MTSYQRLLAILSGSSGLILSAHKVCAQASTPVVDLNSIQFDPLRGPSPVPLLPPEAWLAVIIGGTLIVAFMVWMVRSTRQSSSSTLAKTNPLNDALNALKRLENDSRNLNVREFSSAVSDIVRRYIEQACQIPAQEQTTEEFLQSIQKHPSFTKEIREALAGFLGMCDMAKFAQQSFDTQQRHDLMKEARKLVENLYRHVVKTRKSAESPSSLAPKHT